MSLDARIAARAGLDRLGQTRFQPMGSERTHRDGKKAKHRTYANPLPSVHTMASS
jgi:hypothetical protein